jgi:small subunit ribosomal protein S27Ae
MATTKGGSTKEKKGKKPHKNKPTSKKYALYDSSGKKKNKSCPRCGPGTFLANHKNRLYCGKCHYTEFAEKTH